MKKAIYCKIHKDVVKKLKKARKDAGLDQEKVAEKLGTTQSYISKLEAGQRNINIVRLHELAKIYKKDIGDLI